MQAKLAALGSVMGRRGKSPNLPSMAQLATPRIRRGRPFAFKHSPLHCEDKSPDEIDFEVLLC